MYEMGIVRICLGGGGNATEFPWFVLKLGNSLNDIIVFKTPGTDLSGYFRNKRTSPNKEIHWFSSPTGIPQILGLALMDTARGSLSGINSKGLIWLYDFGKAGFWAYGLILLWYFYNVSRLIGL